MEGTDGHFSRTPGGFSKKNSYFDKKTLSSSLKNTRIEWVLPTPSFIGFAEFLSIDVKFRLLKG